MSDLETDTKGTSSPARPTEPAFAAATTPSYVDTLFRGPDGLRPGWGFAFYVIAFLVLQQAVVQAAWARDLGYSGLWSDLLERIGNFLAAAIPAIILSRIERRPWGAYGLPLKQAFGFQFWAGALWGFLALSLLIFVIYERGGFVAGHIILRGTRLLRFAGFWLVYFIFVALFEDFWLRGYSLFTLARGIGFWPAAAILSSVFGLLHLRNRGEHWPGVLLAAFIGLFFCITLRRTGVLWFAVGFHTAWDWGESFVYSVPDSGMVVPGHLLSSSLPGSDWLTGGSVGPEGSVFCAVVMALVWIAFDRVYRSKRVDPGTGAKT
ncbi:MAG TPA: type II CAAX endopeptidase family protein [Candidatus Sulfotelmatobacter sp.]|nr:type II CAAX endopeptidase family protein [Candidatus Sulfotelmatobacter sp.]